jgi:hypothetical protein
MLRGRTARGRAKNGLEDAWHNTANWNGMRWQDALRRLRDWVRTRGSGWKMEKTQSGWRFFEQGDKGVRQLRISFAHGKPRLYAQHLNRPRNAALQGQAQLK